MEDSTDVLGRRIGAGLLDVIVLVVLLVVVGVIFGEDETSGSSASQRADALERHARRSASDCSAAGSSRPAAATGPGRARSLRTILRIVDGFLFYLVGLIVILATGKRRQRLGDLAGGTTVARA
jgi:uncharacterized RDD family membrane protein YckC